VVTVPAESMLGQSQPIPARPTTKADSFDETEQVRSGDESAFYDHSSGGGLHVGPRLGPRELAARTYGNYALISTLVGLVLIGATLMYGMVLMSQEMAAVAASQPAGAPIAMEQMAEKLALNHPMLAAGPLGALFFAVAGLALGVTSVKHSKRNNWRGVLAIVVCGLFIMFFCGINGLAVMGGMPV